MSKHIATALFGLALTASIFTTTAAAQRVCPAGQEWTAGMCTTSGLAASLTRRSVLSNNVKINQFKLPVPVQQDHASVRPADIQGFDLNNLSGTGRTNPIPRSP